MKHSYEDILHLARPVSTRHARMSMINRAAQFSPFAALTGYEDAIEETGRRTDSRVYLDEQEMLALDRKQQLLLQNLASRPEVSITYFQPDSRKEGGSYVTAWGMLKKIDAQARRFLLTDGTAIAMDDVRDIDSPLFSQLHTAE